MKSETIGKLAEALAKAQSEMQNAAKDKDNPFYKSSYADLASVWDACREPLSKNGLAITQAFNIREDGKIVLNTILMHSSGEYMSSEILIQSVKQDPQGIGSAITYFRRFSLAAIVCVVPEDQPDDDGNAASNKPNPSNVHENAAGDKPNPSNVHENAAGDKSNRSNTAAIIKPVTPQVWKITNEQIQPIKDLCEEIGWDGEALMRKVYEKFGVTKLLQLTEIEYFELLKYLKRIRSEFLPQSGQV